MHVADHRDAVSWVREPGDISTGSEAFTLPVFGQRHGRVRQLLHYDEASLALHRRLDLVDHVFLSDWRHDLIKVGMLTDEFTQAGTG
jgi:hypothetical protein